MSTDPSVAHPPRAFIPRVFDPQILLTDTDIADFTSFVNGLILLERRSFLAAMRAIRTYVVAMHRLADDLELAYTLFVASIESLAQQFDAFQPEWDDYDGGKKSKIDAALKGADEVTARDVRSVLLEIEHVSLARRFREFSLAHISQIYFREAAESVEGPASRADLEDALRGAYRLRSRYVHSLQELPRALAVSAKSGDTVRVEDTTLLTFQGISRLARHVILEFVDRQPKLEVEQYDYSEERYGIVRMPLSPQYWVGEAKNITLNVGTKRLEGFLSQLSGHFCEEENSLITDLTPALVKAEELFASASEPQRRPFLALYLMFNALLPEDRRMSNLEVIRSRYEADLVKPSIESMVFHLVLQITPDWQLNDHRQIYDDYFRQRSSKTGLRVPRTFEAGLSLALAERSRLAGEVVDARNLVAKATESYPGYRPLRDFEKEFVPEREIRWFPIVFPGMSTLDD